MAKKAQTIKDLQNAKTDIICFIQGQSFHNEIYTLNGGEHLKRSSSILKLDPVFDNGILKIERHFLQVCHVYKGKTLSHNIWANKTLWKKIHDVSAALEVLGSHRQFSCFLSNCIPCKKKLRQIGGAKNGWPTEKPTATWQTSIYQHGCRLFWAVIGKKRSTTI